MPGILQRWKQLFRPTIVQYNFGPDAPTQVLNYTARQLYNTQDNLSAVVNFLSNSIAQLPLKTYKRNGEAKRERDRTSPAALLLWKPNTDQTEYEFIRSLLVEYFVFGCVYVWLLPDPESSSGWQLRIVPTDWVVSTEKANSYAPDKILVTSYDGNQIEIPRSEFVRFSTYSPGNPGGYVSPISALRQTLEEQIQAGSFRRELWKSSGRLNAQIIRPKDVKPWDDETRKKWVTAFREAWGPGGSKAGSIPLLEDGMEIKPFSTSFREQQWAESIKLSREAVAAAYGINPSLVWHTDTQTYASSKDNARALYAECLGPVLQMLQQRINAFLLPMIGADAGTYVEFDLSEKLKGSFEERASILQSSVGGPWMTRNEARADNNLPPIEGGDELIVPLNVVAGGQASPQDTHMDTYSGPSSLKEILIKANREISVNVAPGENEIEAIQEVISKFIKRQSKSVLPKLGAKAAEWWDADRWDEELTEDLIPIMREIATNHGYLMSEALGTKFYVDEIVDYIKKTAEARSKIINEETLKKLQEAIEQALDAEEDARTAAEHEFSKREDADSLLLGSMLAKKLSGFGTKDAVRQAKNQGFRRKVYKEWVTGPKARDSHSAMNGQRVLIDDKFSNGAEWPGDDNLSPDESCGCNCSTRVIVE